MIRFLVKLLRVMYVMKRKERLPRLPRGYTTRYNRKVGYDVEKVFHLSGARTPDAIPLLMKRRRVDSIQALIPLLPDPHHKLKPLERLGRWTMRLMGTTPHEPVIKRSLARLRSEGKIPARGTLLRRTAYRSRYE